MLRRRYEAALRREPAAAPRPIIEKLMKEFKTKNRSKIKSLYQGSEYQTQVNDKFNEYNLPKMQILKEICLLCDQNKTELELKICKYIISFFKIEEDENFIDPTELLSIQ